MSNVAGKAYAMNVVTPMRPRLTWINNLAFMFARAVPGTLSGLLGLALIHFARWVIIRRDQWPQLGQPKADLENDYMLFCSNFNGTWDQYIDAFADGIPSGLDLFWYSSTRYPNSIPITPFKNYIRANQIDTNYYYNATPGSGQRDVKLALALLHGLQGIAKRHKSLDDHELASEFERLLIANQGGLGSPGYAPVASCDTAAADRHRAAAELGRWGEGGEGALEAAQDLDPVAAEDVLESVVGDDAAEKEAIRATVTAVLGTPPRTAEAPKPVDTAPRPEASDA